MQAVFYQKIKLPHTKFSVKAWNPTLKNFTAVNSSGICHTNTFENGITINDCDLWVENKVDSKSIGWLLVSYDPFAPAPSGSVKKFEYLTENTRGSLFKVYGDDGSEKYMSF
jgi:hypothetical protein